MGNKREVLCSAEVSQPDVIIVILAAGYATRLRPISNKIAKPLIEINKKTIISRIISVFIEAGFTKFCILIGYMGALIKEEVLKINGIEVDFVEQQEMKGMADAVLSCLNYLFEKKREITNFFVSASDILFSKQEINQMHSLFNNAKADIVLSLMKSNQIEIAKGHGNVKILDASDLSKDADIHQGLKIIDIIEKPGENQIMSEYYSLPLYLFNQKIFSYLKNVEESARGEKELQDAIKMAINNGDNVLGINIIKDLITIENIGKYHLTFIKDVLKMNLRFLSAPNNIIIGKNCRIEKSSKLKNTLLFDNVVVGNQCKLNWCIVDNNVILQTKFRAKNCFITKKENDENLKIINF
ncbi:MAG: sugar phosphate nucleotidyltransferase [Promethearchaeota archaeon]